MQQVVQRGVGPPKIRLNQAGTEAWHFCAFLLYKKDMIIVYIDKAKNYNINRFDIAS